jgi:hypothetical protein
MSRISTYRTLVGGLLTAGSVASVVYGLIVRPWHMRWGAASSEVKRSLPGDDLVSRPLFRATHAVTICASAADVWPWLVQMGQDRAGFYSYDWLENMMGLDIHSADQIIPDLQTLEPGDILPLASGDQGIPAVLAEPCQALVFGGHFDRQTGGVFGLATRPPESYLDVSWAFVLDEVASGITRLIERFQYDHNLGLTSALFFRGILEPVSFIMERKMLLGIKERAEDYARRRTRRPIMLRLEE